MSAPENHPKVARPKKDPVYGRTGALLALGARLKAGTAAPAVTIARRAGSRGNDGAERGVWPKISPHIGDRGTAR